MSGLFIHFLWSMCHFFPRVLSSFQRVLSKSTKLEVCNIVWIRKWDASSFVLLYQSGFHNWWLLLFHTDFRFALSMWKIPLKSDRDFIESIDGFEWCRHFSRINSFSSWTQEILILLQFISSKSCSFKCTGHLPPWFNLFLSVLLFMMLLWMGF